MPHIKDVTYRKTGGIAVWAYPDALPFKDAVSGLWMGALFVPAGFWLRTRKDSVIVACGFFSAVLLVPALTPLLLTPPGLWVAVGLGLGVRRDPTPLVAASRCRLTRRAA